MKTVRKFLATALALIMTLALGVPVSAAETYTITISNPTAGHTYEAYQIFAGDLAEKDGAKVLSNIVWGTGVDQTKTVGGKTLSQTFDGKSAEEVAASLSTEADAKDFAQKVAPYLTNPAVSGAQTDGKYTVSGLKAGYYLVKDRDNTLSNADDFYTAYIMQVVGDVEASPKGDKPTLDKQVKEGNNWSDASDKQIGDTVEFRTVSTVPDTENYTSYTYIISDTMSVGLTSNVKTAADVEILVNDSGDALSTDYYTVTATGNSFTVSIDILKAVKEGKMKAGDSLYAYYSGVLNENAKLYDDTDKNTNTAHLEYSNNPNNSAEEGQTPPSQVYVWTFQMSVNKVDKDNQELTGAKFVLSKTGNLQVADMNCDENGVPAVTTDLIGLIKVADGEYRVANPGESNVVYDIDAGKPVIKGLDQGVDYYLYETKAPAGYNLLKDPVKFQITAQYKDNGASLAEDYPTVSVNNGTASTTLSTNVVNQAGSTLPSTGGMGTTVFYIVGGLLVVVAGVLLVTKKRMNRSK